MSSKIVKLHLSLDNKWTVCGKWARSLWITQDENLFSGSESECKACRKGAVKHRSDRGTEEHKNVNIQK
jgi:hypothetical protein